MIRKSDGRPSFRIFWHGFSLICSKSPSEMAQDRVPVSIRLSIVKSPKSIGKYNIFLFFSRSRVVEICRIFMFPSCVDFICRANSLPMTGWCPSLFGWTKRVKGGSGEVPGD